MSEMGISLEKFRVKLKNFSEVELPKKLVAFQKYIALELFKRILQKTPVDTGILRGSWTVSINQTGFTEGKTDAKNGEKMKPQEKDKLSSLADLKMGDVIYFCNNQKYVKIVEFGGYPNPPKKGSYLRKGQKKGDHKGPGWFMFSRGGFSINAPQGMLMLSIQEVKAKMQELKTNGTRTEVV